jgi:hypothetical protein
MTRQFLPLLLAATQFTSWGASPLYLCVGRGGAVCIDQGSERCTCCHELDESASRCHADCDPSIAHVHEEDEMCPADHDRSAFADSCGCMHYLIVQQQGPVIARGPEGGGNLNPAGRLIASDCGERAVDFLLGIKLALHQTGPLWMISTGFEISVPVVLRC